MEVPWQMQVFGEDALMPRLRHIHGQHHPVTIANQPITAALANTRAPVRVAKVIRGHGPHKTNPYGN